MYKKCSYTPDYRNIRGTINCIKEERIILKMKLDLQSIGCFEKYSFVHFLYFLAPTGSKEILIFVCSFVSSLSLNLQLSTLIFKVPSLRSHSALSQNSLRTDSDCSQHSLGSLSKNFVLFLKFLFLHKLFFEIKYLLLTQSFS